MTDNVLEAIRELLLARVPELSTLPAEAFERLVAFVDEASYGTAEEGRKAGTEAALEGIATQPIKLDRN